MADDLEVIGASPLLNRVVCDALVCEQYWCQGELDCPANVVHLRTGPTWHRLTFDCGVIFWRSPSEAPEPYTMPELEAEVKLDDLGERLHLAGRTLERYESSAVSGGSQVCFLFEGGQKLTFKNVDDATTIVS